MQTSEVPFAQTVIAARAGANKFGMLRCPFCHGQGDELADPKTGGKSRFFCFVDDRSAREYAISGLCQNCQDGVFH